MSNSTSRIVPVTNESNEESLLANFRVEKQHGFHPDRGWSPPVNAPDPSPEPRKPETDFRSLEPLSEQEWASPETAELFKACDSIRVDHEGYVGDLGARVATMRSKDLAAVKQVTPLARLQNRLRLARSAQSYYAASVSYLERLESDAADRADKMGAKSVSTTAEIREKLQEIGLAKLAPAHICSYFQPVQDAVAAASQAIGASGLVRDFKKTHRTLLAQATDAIAWIEGQIRKELDAT